MESIHDTVQIFPWQESWGRIFGEEKQVISDALSEADVAAAIHHVGSTSVKGMDSKPILDILVCPEKEEDLKNIIPLLENTGYKNLGECGREGRYFLSKGTEPNHTFYLHLCMADHPVARDQLLFKRLETEDMAIFRNYLSIKRFLAGMFQDSREIYRLMKGLYIEGVLSAYRKAQADFCSAPEDDGDDSIRYWNYEFEMSPQMHRAFCEIFKKLELTPDEFFQKVVADALKDPEATRRRHEELETHPELLPDIRLVRFYPVHVDETEAQARKRKLAEEAAEKNDK